MASCKYYKLVRQVSYDSGVTWISLDEFQKGDLYENDSPDCGGGITQYRWVNVSGEYTCVGTTKYQKTKKQQSTDGGQTWTDVNPLEYSTGAVIERDSSDCGGGSGYENQYLTLVAKGNGSLFVAIHYGATTAKYSKDNGSSWISLTSTISVNNGDKVMFKGLAENLSSPFDFITGTTQYEVEGNIMSLIYDDNFRGKTSFPNGLVGGVCAFTYPSSDRYNPNLTSIDNLVLPATTLTEYCYLNMFYRCTSLTNVPSNLLPATTLAENCYAGMFMGCTSLTTAPELPASTLVNQCYGQMFQDCSSLNYVKCLATTNFTADRCTQLWLDGVSSSGTFVKASSANWGSCGASKIPCNWTIQNA